MELPKNKHAVLHTFQRKTYANLTVGYLFLPFVDLIRAVKKKGLRVEIFGALREIDLQRCNLQLVVAAPCTYTTKMSWSEFSPPCVDYAVIILGTYRFLFLLLPPGHGVEVEVLHLVDRFYLAVCLGGGARTDGQHGNKYKQTCAAFVMTQLEHP